MALYETNRELESQRLELCEANQWADQVQRDKTNLYGELEMRNRLFRENQATACQEIEELRRICCEETDRARQLRIDDLIVHAKGEESHYCESVFASDSRIYRTK